MKTKAKKHEFQFDEVDCSLIFEALKEKLKKIEEEEFYGPKFSPTYYYEYRKRYVRLLDWFSGKPRPIFKEWKF